MVTKRLFRENIVTYLESDFCMKGDTQRGKDSVEENNVGTTQQLFEKARESTMR